MPIIKITQEILEKFVSDEMCINCKREDLCYEAMLDDNVQITCNDCGTQWTLMYVMTGMCTGDVSKGTYSEASFKNNDGLRL